MSYFPSIPKFAINIPDLPRPPWDPPWEGTLFHNADTGTLCVKDRYGKVSEIAPSGPCGWCGHPFVPEGRRRVCANCGGPRERPF